MSQLSQATREKVFDEHGDECVFCLLTRAEHKEEHGRDLDIHHVIPKRKGGSDDPDNLIPVCISCHRTIEATQGKAFGRIAEKETQIGQIQELSKELRQAESELARLRKSPLADCEIDTDVIVESIKENREARNIDVELVTEHLGTSVDVYTNSESALESYNDWGSLIRKSSINIPDEIIKKIVTKTIEHLTETEQLR